MNYEIIDIVFAKLYITLKIFNSEKQNVFPAKRKLNFQLSC